ncbi:MAG: hypothetical protein DRI44_07640 [Chlamydiae bacterium]|nr:MAG: hypothetical protein DRI44_07640 [Chlamydiota bacterium]
MKIGGRFGSTVFEPLYEHLCKSNYCSNLICKIVDAFAKGHKEKMQKLCDEICETESQADQIKLSIRTGLTKSIFAAVKRNDVLQIVRNQDKICGRAEDVSKLMVIRNTKLPDGCSDIFKMLADKVDKTIHSLLICCSQLAMIPGSGYNTEADADVILVELDKIHDKEEETDNIVQEFTKELLARENESDPLSIILLLEMARLISGMADEAENAAEGYTSLIRH